MCEFQGPWGCSLDVPSCAVYADCCMCVACLLRVGAMVFIADGAVIADSTGQAIWAICVAVCTRWCILLHCMHCVILCAARLSAVHSIPCDSQSTPTLHRNGVLTQLKLSCKCCRMFHHLCGGTIRLNPWQCCDSTSAVVPCLLFHTVVTKNTTELHAASMH